MPGSPPTGYWTATRHPWACAFFVLPLLIFYEAGLYVLGPVSPEEARTGADAWLRGVLQHAGISPLYGAPALLIGALLTWSLWRRADQPRDYLGLWCGMAIESAVFALVLLCLSQLLLPALQWLGRTLESPALQASGPLGVGQTAGATWEQIIGYLGAGIYEEAIFRLFLFSAAAALLRLLALPGWVCTTAAALFSAVAFAAAHNIGPQGEPFELVVTLYRTCAGLYFSGLYHFRGFGIAVGAHACYDMLVGLLLRTI